MSENKELLELSATLRLCSSIPHDVSVLVEKENVQFYVVTQKGKFQTVLHLHFKIKHMLSKYACDILNNKVKMKCAEIKQL